MYLLFKASHAMIRVMSFNIRYGTADDGDHRWEMRKTAVLERVLAFQPTLLGLQECRDDEQATFIRNRLPAYHFLGRPRGHHAEHAHETPNSMTVPLMLLAFFAVTLGFVGMPEEIVGHGNNWFHGFVGHEYPATPLSLPVMLLSAVLAVGGLGLGWLVYGRKPLAHGEMDPLERAMQKVGLGWLYEAMRRKFYFDEIYHATFIRGAIKLADIFFYFDNRWVVDPIVNGVGRGSAALASALFRFVDMPIIDGAVNLAGRVGRLLSDIFGLFDLKVIDGLVDLAGRTGASLSAFSGLTDDVVVDGAVNGIGQVTGWVGARVLRPIQTGKVQNYLLVALITVLALLGLYLVYW